MHQVSQFPAQESEFLFELIEDLKSFFTPEALFLIEEIDPIYEDLISVCVKVKDGNNLYEVESSAKTLYSAAKQAQNKIKNMVLDKLDKDS